MDFIFDPSLVLYLPLYELDGASFMSKDKHGHLCTATGALWTPRGRSFDGTDDLITLNQTSVIEPTHITVEIWINTPGTGDWQSVLVKFDRETNFPNNNNFGYQMFVAGGASQDKIRWGVGDGSAFYESFSDAAITLNAWQHIVGTYDGAGVAHFINAIKQADVHSFSGNISHDGNLYLGLGEPSLGLQQYSGAIGEVRIYNRALTPSEVQHNYLATKWRYR